MVLRNVPSTATFEEQRVEINELAVDVDTLASNPDTLQTVTDRGFATTNPIRIENYAATAFVIEDNSNNEKFVVDSVNGKINVGSSAGGASGIYLFHNNSGATPAITLDGATGSITNKGQLVTESILSSAALNNKGSVQFGTVDAYSIGHMPLNSNLAFSQTHGGSYLFYSDASTVELEIASGGVKVDGILESSLLVNTNKTPTAGEGIEVFYDSAASGGAAGSIQAYDRDGTALTRLKIRSSNWEIDNDGSGTFGGDISIQDSSYLRVRLTGDNTSTAVQLGPDGTGSFASGAFTVSSSGALSINRTAGTNDILAGQLNGTVTTSIKANGSAQFGESGGNFVSVDTDGKLTARNSSSSATVVLAANFNGTDNFTVAANGTITSNSGLSATGVNLQSSSTNSWFQTGTSIASTNYVWAAKDSSNNVWHSGLQTDGDLYLGGNLSGSNNIELSGSDGTGWFQNPNGDTTLSLGDLTNSNGRLVLTAKSNALEIHSRSNHPIEFLFNTVTKTKMTIDGGINFEASGAGIVFDWQTQASGATSDKLDHYEEGTWTPTIDRLSGSPTTATYSYNTGKYTRIGNVVTVYFDLNITALGGGAGRFVIAGLPFNSATDSNSGGYGSPQFRNSTAFSVEAQERPSSYHSVNTINLRYVTSSNGEDDMTVGPGRITGWSVYFTS